ncbi:MAG: exodeoxyribonuclease VII large subunit [Acidimicrobiales bacterium]
MSDGALFDESVGRGPDADTWTVGELAAHLGRLLVAALPDDVWVAGQIRNLSRANNGHVYFDLVEPTESGRAGGPAERDPAGARARAGEPPAGAGRRGVRMSDGVEVRIQGRIRWYAPRGSLQLRMHGIDPAFTLGRLQADRDRLLAALGAEGLLDANARVPMPLVPLRVGVVTSRGTAAHADVMAELEASGIGFEVVLADARTQGPDCGPSVARPWPRSPPRRSTWCCSCAAAAPAPTSPASTPSRSPAPSPPCRCPCSPASATRSIGPSPTRSPTGPTRRPPRRPPRSSPRCRRSAAAWSSGRRRCSERWPGRRGWPRPDSTIAGCAPPAPPSAPWRADQRLAQRTARAGALRSARSTGPTGTSTWWAPARRGARSRLDAAAVRLDAQEARTGVHDPALALARGWSITTTATGRLVRRPADAPPGTELITRLAQGTVHSTVVPDPTDAPEPAP